MENILINNAKEKFNLFQFLDENNIEYRMSGKNIGEGFIGIEECWHCGIRNYHYGINIEGKYGTCWSCGRGDNLLFIIVHILHINYKEAEEYLISSTYSQEDIEVQVHEIFNSQKQKQKIKPEKEIVLPQSVPLYKYIGKNKTITRFCEDKKITPQLSKYLDLKIGINSKCKNKLIIPIYYGRDLVAYQARSFINRYFKNEGPLKHYLYQYNNIKKEGIIFIVEGVTDWISTNNFIQLFRKNKNYYVTTPFSKILTQEQIELLEAKDPSMVVFMLDYDAWYQYYNPSYKMFCDTDFIILPKDKDPGNMNNFHFMKSFLENGL
jgi:hypothetical protein